MLRTLFAVTLTVVAVNLGAAADVPEPFAAYPTEIRPLLVAYCGKCHNPDDQDGGVDITSVQDTAAALAKTKLWKRTRNRIADEEMPPPDEKQPTPAERAKLLAWLTFAGNFVDCDPARRDPGPPLLRRLTRTEHDNTIRDLLAIPFSSATAVGMPADEPGEGRFDTLAASLSLSPALMDKYFAAADKVLDKAFAPGYPGVNARKQIFIAEPGKKGLTEPEAAKAIFGNLLRRAYRRPTRDEDVARLLGLFERAKSKGVTFEDAIRAGMKPILVSPQFLFRIEADRAPAANAPGSPVDAHELAVRLSYFLWSSMPDDELFRLADDGTLTDPDVLQAQVKRMLADKKARAMTDGFAVQWLQLGKLANARPTTEFFPTFKGPLKQAMYDEATTFFDHLRTSDRSVLDLLDADYTFANRDLAEHYGLKGVDAKETVRVSLRPEDHRGGILGMSAVLAMTSHTFRTSPTQRGKYVLEVIFGTPPPPPPANVPPLADEGGKKKTPQTLKEQLALHASQPSCAGCHRKIDPLGFALENYNAVGAWRESTPDSLLDTAGVLPGGIKVNGVADLKRVILSRKDEFVHNLAGRMLEYAIGRELDAIDECTVREVTATLQKNDYRFSVMVTEIVKSVPFRQRRTVSTQNLPQRHRGHRD